jgi:hypothetical protein
MSKKSRNISKRKFTARYLFYKSALPEQINDDMAQTCYELKGYEDKLEVLQKAYEIVTTRFEGGRVKTFSKLYDLVSTSTEDLWNRTGFVHCTNQNYLLTLLLVSTGKFSEDEIKPKWTFIWFCSPHQYLKVKVNDEYINVDCWARHYGIKFGKYAKGFNTSILKKFA